MRFAKGVRRHIRTSRVRYFGFAVVFAMLSGLQLLSLKSMDYSTSIIEACPSDALSIIPTSDFSLGSLKWDLANYTHDPNLEPLRDFFRKHTDGETGISAAIRLSNVFATAFPNGQASKEFLDAQYDPAVALQSHLDGEPGHCVTRSGLIAAILLSVGIPARVVQVIGDEHGHNLLEVSDDQHGWILLDPLYGTFVGRENELISAEDAIKFPESLHGIPFDGGINLAGSGVDTVYRFLFKGDLLYPEPWLYMRVGERASYWPFRGKFVHVGSNNWRFGGGQRIFLFGALSSVLVAIFFALRGIVFQAAPQLDEESEENPVSTVGKK